MGKKVIRLTESDLQKIVRRVISEQSEERKHTIAIQKFLNDKEVMNAKLVPDGKTGAGSQTEEAIMKLNILPLKLNIDQVCDFCFVFFCCLWE